MRIMYIMSGLKLDQDRQTLRPTNPSRQLLSSAAIEQLAIVRIAYAINSRDASDLVAAAGELADHSCAMRCTA